MFVATAGNGYWNSADEIVLLIALARASAAPQEPRQQPDFAEWRRALASIGTVGTYLGIDTVMRSSVLDIFDRRVAALAAAPQPQASPQAPSATSDDVRDSLIDSSSDLMAAATKRIAELEARAAVVEPMAQKWHAALALCQQRIEHEAEGHAKAAIRANDLQAALADARDKALEEAIGATLRLSWVQGEPSYNIALHNAFDAIRALRTTSEK